MMPAELLRERREIEREKEKVHTVAEQRRMIVRELETKKAGLYL